MNQNGYRASHRNRTLLVSLRIIGHQELSLFDYYIDRMVFDTKKPKHYCTFTVDFKELQTIFGKKSNNTVRGWHKKLVSVGLIIPVSKHTFTFPNPERFICAKAYGGKANEWASKQKDQPIATILQIYGVKPHIIEQLTQSVEKNNSLSLENSSSRYLSSFKVSPVHPLTPSKEEYEKERVINPLLPVYEDMLLINESLREKS